MTWLLNPGIFDDQIFPRKENVAGYTVNLTIKLGDGCARHAITITPQQRAEPSAAFSLISAEERMGVISSGDGSGMAALPSPPDGKAVQPLQLGWK